MHPSTLVNRTLNLFCAVLCIAPAAAQTPSLDAAWRSRDYAALALELPEHAASGSAVALFRLGALYEGGKGVASVDLAKASELYRKAAAQGSADAQYRLARMLLTGRGIGQDRQAAYGLALDGAKAGHAGAQGLVGEMLIHGDGTLKDQVAGREWLRRAAENGDVVAMETLAMNLRYDNAEASQERYAEAFRWASKAASLDSPVGFELVGSMMLTGQGTRKDQEGGLLWVQRAAEAGLPGAMALLGAAHKDGIGVTKDPVKAAGWLRAAADQGDRIAQRVLGLMLLSDEGIPNDPQEGVRLLRASAEQDDAKAALALGRLMLLGKEVDPRITAEPAYAISLLRPLASEGNSSAQYFLGLAYDDGLGVERSAESAIRWYEKAAGAGESSAMVNLGVMYSDGRGVIKSRAKAIAWFKQAAMQGHGYGQHNLGVAYREGLGVPVDLVLAYAWLNLASVAALEPHPKAGNLRDSIEQRMTRRQIEQAQRLASGWSLGVDLAQRRSP
jgi:TPR repeat protein